ncbi:hypothetical protein WJX77_003816 [Trebouxia sp. C0004]
MRITVHLAPFGAGVEKEHTVELFCGIGSQILQWVGYTACARLAYARGEVMNRYVPQSVMTPEGEVLDIHIVLNEMFKSGDKLFVEYSDGPIAYKARWEGRPRTPPFQWGAAGEVLPPHDQWLRDFDGSAWGLDKLVEPALLQQNPNLLERDLQETRDVLLQWAGALQAIFTIYQLQGEADVTVEHITRMNIQQFRHFISNAKVAGGGFSAEKADESFAAMAPLCRGSSAKMDSNTSATITLVGFLAALAHLAHARAAAATGVGGVPNTAAYTQLATKLESLIHTCLEPNIMPEIARRMSKKRTALTPGAVALLQKGRRLTEHSLNTCQLKRVKAAAVRVDLRYVCNHLIKWRLLNKEFNLPDLAYMSVFAKQTSDQPSQFVLQPHPIDLDYDDFERLLFAMTCNLHQQRKRKEPLEEYLGEIMDFVYKKAGVLQEAGG